MSLNNFGGGFRANGTIAPSRFVVIDTSADGLCSEAANTTTPILGISQVGQKRAPGLAGSDVTIAAQAGDVVRLYGLGDVAPLQVAGTVTRGALIQANGTTDGRGISVASGGGGECGARALQSGTANQIILVQVLCRLA